MSGCRAEIDLKPTIGAVSLGEAVGYEKIGDVSKSIVARGSEASVPLPDGLPRSRLHLAIAALGRDPDAPAATVCEARIASGDRAEAVLARLELPSDAAAWSEATADTPAFSSGALRLRCEDPAGHPVPVAWARPIAVPLDRRRPAPLIVLISLDTLRADHVDGFGGARGLTPNLGAMADEGVRMVNATSEGAWTLASHYALLFSRLYGFPVEPKPLTSLAQALSDHGFVTLGLTGGGFMGAAFNYHLGFHHYGEYDTGSDDLPLVLEDAVAMIRRFETAPTFLFLHSFAVHQSPPNEVKWHERHGDFEVFRPSPQEIAIARDFYAGIVEKADAEIAPFFDRLREIAERRPVLVVIVSDHGDAFGEHENFRHGFGDRHVTLHDEVVHVPVVAWAPGILPDGLSIRRPTMLADIAPTILGAVGAPTPQSMRGTDSWQIWTTGDEGVLDPSLGSVSRTQRVWALRTDRWKLIAEMSNRRGRPGFELFDLAADPGETNDLARSRPEELRAMLAQLRQRLAELGVPLPRRRNALPICRHCAWQDRDTFWKLALEGSAVEGSARPGEIDQHTLQRLRDLGYTD